MSDTSIAKDRGQRILALLRQHGPLSFRGIKAMIEPKMKERRIHDAIARIYRDGLIEKRQERLFRGTGIFYQISQHPTALHKVAEIINCNHDELKQPYFRSRELLHTEACALWAHRLRALFPEAVLIRDYEFQSHPLVQEIMLTHQSNFELRPDILMTFKATGANHRVTVAIEVEKSRKSERRLQAKLQKYATETALDGVIYLCDSAEVSEPVRRVYESKIMNKAIRVNHYGENFFLFQNENNPYGEQTMKTFQTCLSPVSIDRWIHELKQTPFNSRRDHFFRQSAANC